MSGFLGMGMHRVRWAKGGEPEMQCFYCYEFLPIASEFWRPEHGLRRCATCYTELDRKRVRTAMRRKRTGVPSVEQAYDADRYRRTRSTLARVQRENAA